MSVKHFVLLLIFLLNSAVTAFADYIHIEIETQDSSQEHWTDHNEKHSASIPSNEPCEDHGSCHSGHFHHYLVSSAVTSLGSSLTSYLEFSIPQVFYNPHFFDIIKPPLVRS